MSSLLCTFLSDLAGGTTLLMDYVYEDFLAQDQQATVNLYFPPPKKDMPVHQ